MLKPFVYQYTLYLIPGKTGTRYQAIGFDSLEECITETERQAASGAYKRGIIEQRGRANPLLQLTDGHWEDYRVTPEADSYGRAPRAR